jgi:hypothetical protein
VCPKRTRKLSDFQGPSLTESALVLAQAAKKHFEAADKLSNLVGQPWPVRRTKGIHRTIADKMQCGPVSTGTALGAAIAVVRLVKKLGWKRTVFVHRMKGTLEPSAPSIIPNPCASSFLTIPIILSAPRKTVLLQHLPWPPVEQETSLLIVLSRKT